MAAGRYRIALRGGEAGVMSSGADIATPDRENTESMPAFEYGAGGQFLRHRFGDIFWKRAFDAVQQVVEVRADFSREFQPKCNVSAID